MLAVQLMIPSYLPTRTHLLTYSLTHLLTYSLTHLLTYGHRQGVGSLLVTYDFPAAPQTARHPNPNVLHQARRVACYYPDDDTGATAMRVPTLTLDLAPTLTLTLTSTLVLR